MHSVSSAAVICHCCIVVVNNMIINSINYNKHINSGL